MKLSFQYTLLYSSLFVGAKLAGVNAKLRFRQTPDATVNAVVVERELQFTATGAESTSYTAADTTTAETTTTETTQETTQMVSSFVT